MVKSQHFSRQEPVQPFAAELFQRLGADRHVVAWKLEIRVVQHLCRGNTKGMVWWFLPTKGIVLWCVVGMARERGVLVGFEVILVNSQQIQWGKPRKCREFWWILVVASIKDVGIQHEDIGTGTDEWSVNGSCLFHLLWNDFHGEIFSVCWCKHVKGPKKSDPK